MNRIHLDIVRGPHPASLDAGHPVETARLFVDLSLAAGTGWTSFQAMVVDTGAAVSLLPRRFWESATLVTRGRAKIGGLARRPECLIDATLAEVDCLLSDGTAVIGPLRIPAYLADSDEVAALLGFAGILDRLVLHVDTAGKGAYFEEGSR
jgi:hypothetical protein